LRTRWGNGIDVTVTRAANHGARFVP
jgi:hypothetical protein